jgi:hypothetical protein
MRLEEIQRNALELPDAQRAALALALLDSLPSVLVDSDDGVSEARRRSGELDRDPSAGCSWEEIAREVRR